MTGKSYLGVAFTLKPFTFCQKNGLFTDEKNLEFVQKRTLCLLFVSVLSRFVKIFPEFSKNRPVFSGNLRAISKLHRAIFRKIPGDFQKIPGQTVKR
jgi:hypothetical protein